MNKGIKKVLALIIIAYATLSSNSAKAAATQIVEPLNPYTRPLVEPLNPYTRPLRLYQTADDRTAARQRNAQEMNTLREHMARAEDLSIGRIRNIEESQERILQQIRQSGNELSGILRTTIQGITGITTAFKEYQQNIHELVTEYATVVADYSQKSQMDTAMINLLREYLDRVLQLERQVEDAHQRLITSTLEAAPTNAQNLDELKQQLTRALNELGRTITTASAQVAP